MRTGVVITVLLLMAAGCAGSDPSPGTALPTGEARWILDEPRFYLAGASTKPRAGHRWTLEYTTGSDTLQIVAFTAGDPMHALVTGIPKIGEAKVDGFDPTLRRFAGLVDKEIGPSVGADWIDHGLLIQFGGPSLTEAELRGHLKHLRRVDRPRWDAELAKAPPDIGP